MQLDDLNDADRVVRDLNILYRAAEALADPTLCDSGTYGLFYFLNRGFNRQYSDCHILTKGNIVVGVEFPTAADKTMFLLKWL